MEKQRQNSKNIEIAFFIFYNFAQNLEKTAKMRAFIFAFAVMARIMLVSSEYI